MALGVRNSLLQAYVRRSGGRLPDLAHRQLAEEACKTRPWICATLVAQWIAEYPESPDRDALVLALGKQARSGATSAPGAPVAGPVLRPIAKPATRSKSPGRAPLELFLDYFFFGAPFSREALASLCSAARTRRARRVGRNAPASNAASAARRRSRRARRAARMR